MADEKLTELDLISLPVEATDLIYLVRPSLGASGSFKGAVGDLPSGTPADDSITNAKLAEMAANAVKVNATASTANPTDVAMAASTILARLASGDIVAATTTEIRTLLALVIGTNVQAYDADLTTWAGITPGTGVGTQLAKAANGTDSGAIGFRGIPTTNKSADYTFADADNGTKIYHPSADTSARTFTFDFSALTDPANFVVTIINDASAGVITIAFANGTGILAGSGTTGSRTLAANGLATIAGATSVRAFASGTGLT